MSELNQQNQYESQDVQANQEAADAKKDCMKCCCDYMKWSVKAACKMFECVFQCMTC